LTPIPILGGLGRRIFLALLGVALLPFVILTAISYLAGRDSLRREAEEHVSLMGQLTRLRVRDSFDETRDILRSTVAGNRVLSTDLALWNDPGTPAAAKEAARRDLSEHLGLKRGEAPLVSTLFVLDARGILFASSREELEGSDLGASPLFTEGGRGPWLGVASLGPRAVRLVASVPVPGQGGRPGGILGGALDLDRLVAQLTLRTPGEGGIRSYLLDDAGEVLVSSPGSAIPRGAAAPAALRAWIGSGARTGEGPDWDGGRAYLSALPVGVQRWVLVTELPVPTAMAPLAKLRSGILLLAGLLLVFVIAAAMLVSGTITRPILVLRDRVRALAPGTPAAPEADEVRALTREFERMSAALRASHADLAALNESLAREVEARTHDLRESEARYRILIESSPNGILATDAHGRIVFASPAAEAIFGHAPAELVGRPLARYFLRGREEAKEILERLAREGKFAHRTTRIVSADGRVLTVNLSSSLLRNEAGVVVGTLLIANNITAQKQLEERLLQTQRLAAIGQMSAKVAHEIRNPLSSVSLNTELLREELEAFRGADTREAAALLDAIASEVDRLARLTDEYIRFARLPTLAIEPCDLTEVLRRTLDFMAPEFEVAGVTVRTHLQPDLPPIPADAQQIRQVFVNLLRNALEAMPKGGEIRLRTRLQGDHAAVLLQDTGTGIRQEDLSEIFNPFFTTKERGTGLGLAMSLEIISGHGGTITPCSGPGEGTTFEILLPREPPARAAEAASGEEGSIDAGTPLP
jgi:PAS domain S-box-containing protein